jgi:hypothetical protein
MKSVFSPKYIRTMHTIWSSTNTLFILSFDFPSQPNLTISIYSVTCHYIYQLTPGLPCPSEDCRVNRETNDSLTVVCQPAWSGGLTQTFHLELWDGKEKELLRNATEKKSMQV